MKDLLASIFSGVMCSLILIVSGAMIGAVVVSIILTFLGRNQ